MHKKNNLPAQTRKFKHVAEYAINACKLLRRTARESKRTKITSPRSAFGSYRFFGNTDVDKIDLKALAGFDTWRTKQNNKPFSQSGINNHNAALNRVFDEAELQDWLVKSLRPTLLNKGTKRKNRGSFTNEEYTEKYTALRSWHKKQTVRKRLQRAKCCAITYCF